MGVGCNPYDISSSEDIYRMVMNAIKPDVIQRYHRVKNYYDMSAGFPSAWDDIYKIEDTSIEDNSVAIHCLGGKGRTGSVLLYLYMRDITEVRKRIGLEHYGYPDIAEFLYNMRDLLFNERGTSKYQTNKDEAAMEIFKIGSSTRTVGGLTVTRLLRQRINRILFNLARHKRISDFYSYRCPQSGNRPIDEFLYPIKHNVDWDIYKRGGYDDNSYRLWFD
jgi:hypothetical protein